MKSGKSFLSVAAAVFCTLALPASAQVIIGGSEAPSVEVNWGVLDSLGPLPTLPDMLRDAPQTHSSVRSAAVAPIPEARPESPGAVYKPYAPAKAKAKPARKVVSKPQAKVEKTVVKAEPVAKPVKTTSSTRTFYPSPEDGDLAIPAYTPPVRPLPPQIPIPETRIVSEAPKPVAPVAVVAPPPPPVVAPSPVAAPIPAPVVQAARPVPASVPVPVSGAKVAVGPGISRKGDVLTFAFDGDSSRLPDGARAELETMARRMEGDESLGLQLMSYADGDEASTSKARRLSLSRALEIRKELMELGVRSTRIEVRALGNKNDGGGPADRVDSVLAAR